MIRLYFSYIASNLITPFLVSTIFFVSFLMTFELFRIMSLVSSDEIGFSFILGMVGNVLVTLIPMAIPISIYFSTIFSLNRMSGDSEYVAMRAGGLDKKNILLPYMIVATMTAICLYFLNQQLVPDSHRAVRKKIKIISSTSLIQGLKSGQFFTSLDNITIFPSKVDEQTKDIEEIFLHIFEPQTTTNKVIVAKSGKIIHDKNEKTGLESFKLFLKNGSIINRDSENNDIEKILFKEYELPISEQRFNYRTVTKEIMMNHAELVDFINGGVEKAVERGFKEKDYFNARYEYWNRINTPILCLILTFLGFGLGVTGNRGRGKNSSGKAILLLIGYYIIYFAFVSQAKDDKIPVILCALVPNFLLLLVGIRFYRRVDWLS